jgi:hypothetical protein
LHALDLKLGAFLRENGQTYESGSDRGQLRWLPYPQVLQQKDCHKELIQLEGLFGLLPGGAPPKKTKESRLNKHLARGK